MFFDHIVGHQMPKNVVLNFFRISCIVSKIFTIIRMYNSIFFKGVVFAPRIVSLPKMENGSVNRVAWWTCAQSLKFYRVLSSRWWKIREYVVRFRGSEMLRTMMYIYALFLNKFKPEVLGRVWCPIRFALVHHAGRTVDERPVTNIRVADDPSHIGGHPPNGILVHTINCFHRPASGYQMSTDRSQNPFRLTFV